MKAISIRQPWAHAILHLGKRVENRDWAGCAYRGPVLLHASKTLKLREFDDAIMSIRSILATVHGRSAGLTPQPPTDLAVWNTARGIPRWRPAPTLAFGGIVGKARILGVISAGKPDCPSARSPWYDGGFALVLADVEPLAFYPWKGALGLFDVPDDIDLRGA